VAPRLLIGHHRGVDRYFRRARGASRIPMYFGKSLGDVLHPGLARKITTARRSRSSYNARSTVNSVHCVAPNTPDPAVEGPSPTGTQSPGRRVQGLPSVAFCTKRRAVGSRIIRVKPANWTTPVEIVAPTPGSNASLPSGCSHRPRGRLPSQPSDARSPGLVQG
jgi:hypothetical protein